MGISEQARTERSSQQVQVFLVDDHAATRMAIATLLRHAAPDIRVVGSASTLATARLGIRECLPDVVVLDLDLGDETGFELLPWLRHEMPATAVVILSASDDPEVSSRAIAEGASQFVTKFMPTDNVIAAIRGAARKRPAHVTNVMVSRDNPPVRIG